MFKISAAIIFYFSITSAGAQSNFWNSKQAYLNQSPPNDTPKLFAQNMLIPANDTGIALDRIAFSNNGKEFYYCYNTTWFSTANLKIKYFRYVKNAWQGPLINDGIAHRWGEYVTPDNKYLFFTKGTSEKHRHIYWVRFDKLLQKLTPKEIK